MKTRTFDNEFLICPHCGYKEKVDFAWDWECYHLLRTDHKDIIYKEIKEE